MQAWEEGRKGALGLLCGLTLGPAVKYQRSLLGSTLYMSAHAASVVRAGDRHLPVIAE